MYRSGLVVALTLSVPGVALADVRPDPVDVSGPYGLVYVLVLLAAGVGYYFYRRRSK